MSPAERSPEQIPVLARSQRAQVPRALAAGPCTGTTCAQFDICLNTAGLGPVTAGQQRTMLQGLVVQQRYKMSNLRAERQKAICPERQDQSLRFAA